MRCPNCGNENPADYVFCDECGARLQNVGSAGADAASTPSAPLTTGSSGSESGSAFQPSGGLSSSSGAGEISPIGGAGGSISSGSLGGASGFDSVGMDSGTIAGADMSNSSGSLASGGLSSAGDSGTQSEYSMPSGSASEGEPMAQPDYGSSTPSQSQTADSSASSTDDNFSDNTSLPQYNASPLQSENAQPSTGQSGSGDGDGAATPATEDTVSSTPVDTDDGASQDEIDTDDSDTSLPGVVPMMGSYSDSEGSSADASSGMSYSGASTGGEASNSAALNYLNTAEQAISQGDWSGFGQAMHSLRSYLQGSSGGAQGSSTGAGASTQSSNPSSISGASNMGAGATDTTSGSSAPSTSGASNMGAGATDTTSGSSAPSTSGASSMGAGAVDSTNASSTSSGAGASGGLDSISGSYTSSPMTGTQDTFQAPDSDLSGMGMSVGGGMASGPMPAGMTSGPISSAMPSGPMPSGMASGPMPIDTGMQSGPMPTNSGSDMDSMSGDSSVATLEPAAEAGTLGADAAAQPAEPEVTMARLVMIATGAELPLPDQEEILVGREDPSSGIFPDIDLTPYGGEDGGVSRRHSRLLHIGDDYFVEDLQSTNYTKLDGQRLPAHVRERLEDGARLDFGRVATIFRRS